MNYTCVLHTGTLPLGLAYCTYVLVELAFTYQTIVSLYQQSNHQSAHSGCHPPIYIPFLLGLAPNQGSMWNKWKNHFSEMKGDVGMSRHEKEGEQEDAYTETGNGWQQVPAKLLFRERKNQM